MQPETLLNFLLGSHQDYHPWSEKIRAGEVAELMLLHNHLQKAVSSMTAGAASVSYLAASSCGSEQVQQHMLLTVPHIACCDTVLNFCTILNVLTEALRHWHLFKTQTEFKMHDCQ